MMRLQIMPWGTFSWESQCKHLVLARGGRESGENTAPYMWSVSDFERPLQSSLDTVEVSIHSPQKMVCWVSQWWTWETRSWEMLQTSSWWQINQGPRLYFLGFWVQSGFPRVLKLYNILKGIRSSWIATMLLDWYNSHQCNVAQSWTCADRERQSERGGGEEREMGTSLAAAASPKKMVWPCESRKRSSNRSKTSLQGWWMEAMTVRPSLARFFNVVITKKAEALHPTRRSCGSNYEWSRL